MTARTIVEHAKALLEPLPRAIRYTAILGGGALRAFYDGTPIHDVDLFFRSRAEYDAAVFELRRIGWTAEVSPRGVTNFRSPSGLLYSLIGFGFGAPLEHLTRFDFRCCQHIAGWISSATDEPVVLSAPGAAEEARCKLLYVVNNNGTERTLRRIRHYVEDYGYELHPGQEEAEPEEEEDVPPGHLPQGVHGQPSVPPEDGGLIARALRRLARIPVTTRGY